ncbi:MAG: 4-phosphoerythronate dehydrogenase [Kangiellaceae bacterium]|nr:4-phosphoerythronate dehydrogenase [Kangiellaceae bacterium]MCW8998638.1 4-phosphoerythronate dehydrogenase [Kangiellaceae bacterium]
MYRIVADENMPNVKQLFGEFGHVVLRPGREINHQDLIDADALLCRSITPVTKELLQGTQVKFVGTATIGTDHLDINWLNSKQIRWANAAGCNADAVVQYVMSAISYWFNVKTETDYSFSLKRLEHITVGIIGAGNVGTRLATLLDQIGIKYLLCDPPLQRSGDKREFNSIKEILNCDVVTLHVPLNLDGEDKTYHLFDRFQLESLSSSQLLVNASRGAIIDNDALLDYLASPTAAKVVLDVFEGEPTINFSLVQKCLLATPHIAGHTLEGKTRGSYMIYTSFCEYFKLPKEKELAQLLPSDNQLEMSFSSLEGMFLSIYDIVRDHRKLTQSTQDNIAEHFDNLRKNYVSSFKVPRRDYVGWDSKWGNMQDKRFWEKLTRFLTSEN